MIVEEIVQSVIRRKLIILGQTTDNQNFELPTDRDKKEDNVLLKCLKCLFCLFMRII